MDQQSALQLVNDYIQFLKEQKFKITRAYMFGSYAKGKQDEDSDIDLAVIFKKLRNKDHFDMQIELMKLRWNYDLRIEPHPFAEKDFTPDSPFANEIMKTGIKIL